MNAIFVWLKLWFGRIRIAVFPPLPPESEDVEQIRLWVADAHSKGRHDVWAELLLETHDVLLRTKRQLRSSNIENRVLYLFAVAVAVFCAFLVTKVSDLQTEQQSGRKISLSVTCTVLGAIAEGGKATISTASGGPANPKLERGLRRLGLPPFKVRQKQAQAAGDAYVNGIAQRVQDATGVSNLIRDDGTINCARLRSLAKLTPVKP